MLKVEAITPITRMAVLGLTLFNTSVAAIKNVAVISLDGIRPSLIGRLSMPLSLSSRKSFKTFAKCAAIPNKAPAQNIQSGGVRSVEITSAAGRRPKASA